MAADKFAQLGSSLVGGLEDQVQVLAGGAGVDATYQVNADDVNDLPAMTRQIYVSGASAVTLTFSNKAGRKVIGYVLQPGRHSLRITRIWNAGLTIPAGVQLWAEW